MARSNSVRSTLNAKAFSHYAPFSIDKMCASGIDAYAECLQKMIPCMYMHACICMCIHAPETDEMKNKQRA